MLPSSEDTNSNNNNTNDKEPSSESIRKKAADALSSRLLDFRTWLKQEAGCTVHPSICIVNSEVTDGTKNAPVLTLGVPSDLTGKQSDRLGSVDGLGEESLYARTMGCQVRAVREMKKGDSIITIPRPSMITPDLVASSDAGRAVLACCKFQPPIIIKAESNQVAAAAVESAENSFWDAFANTRTRENSFKTKTNTGPQLLVKILQERKRVETAFATRLAKQQQQQQQHSSSPHDGFVLADRCTISTRAPLLAFLIHQRFHNDGRPYVCSKGKKAKEQFKALLNDEINNNNHNALKGTLTVIPPPGSPETFGPYVRTLPASVLIPLCWTREELALLSGCIPGRAILEDVLAQTMQLASEFISLLDAGILERFPETFAPGTITWDRWVWAASIVSSRILPATAYFNKADTSASTFKPNNHKEFQSPPEIWDELGVMVPLLDMLNHEIDAHQVRWQPNVTDELATEEEEPHPPRGVLEKKVKKGAELFCAYGDVSNHNLVLQYGMAQINNLRDEARIGWGLSEAVGHAEVPVDFTPPVDGGDNVYESNDRAAIDKWWTDDRLKLLEREASLGEPLIASLKQERKLSALAYNDGALHPVLLAASVVASMPKSALAKVDDKVTLNQRHQRSLRNLLASLFAKKLEKLLLNLDSGLKDHYNNLSLWTRASKGGLKYKPAAEDAMEEDEKKLVGWQTFFEEHAYRSSMEVEKNYYAMAPDSCVLALYDGHLRSLQLSADIVANEETFKKDVAKQLQDLGYMLSDEPGEEEEEEAQGETDTKPPSSTVAPAAEKESNASTGVVEKKSSPGRRRRNRNRKAKEANAAAAAAATGEKPPALKLHVGNLAYSTTPSDLYDFFCSIYGKDNILECHIPTERESGRSRGFGFVTMPESVAVKALSSGKKHEIAGRLLKVARSNSAGTTDTGRAPSAAAAVSKDRCATCGYRPRYCVCSVPNLPTAPPPFRRNGDSHDGPPPPDSGWRLDDDRNRPGDGRYHDVYMEERYGRIRSHERGGYGGGPYDSNAREYDRDRDRDWRRDRPSSSRSYHSDFEREDRHRDRRKRSRDRDRDRSFSRSPSPGRRRGDSAEPRGNRRDSHRDFDYDRKRSHSPPSRSSSRSSSRSRSPERSRRKKSKKRES